jgi:hypothetical protein
MLEPWDYNQIKRIKGWQDLVWSDEEAIIAFPKHSWVYDKKRLADKQGMVPTVDLDRESPKEYPVFVRPRINLNGMSIGAGIVTCEEELPKDYGYIAQPVLPGNQYTTDYVIKDNKIIDKFTFKATRDKRGSFFMFESVKKEFFNVEKFIESLKLGTRVVNVENIEECILEMHLRPSMQFIGICGGLIEQIPAFFKTGRWARVKQEKTYSRLVRVSEDGIYDLDLEPKVYPGVDCWQKCWYDEKRVSKATNDENSYRLYFVNGRNKLSIELTIGELLNHTRVVE